MLNDQPGHRPRRRPDPPHDRGPVPRHLPGHPAAGGGRPHPALQRAEEVQRQKITYADKLHIPYVAFLGEEEISQGLVKIKDMVTGDQQALSPAQAVETIAAAMAHRAQGKPIREKG